MSRMSDLQARSNLSTGFESSSTTTPAKRTSEIEFKKPAPKNATATTSAISDLDRKGNPLADWLDFLQTQWFQAGAPSKSVAQLYQHATQYVEIEKNKRSEGLLQLHLEHARLLMEQAAMIDEAKEVFKFLKSQVRAISVPSHWPMLMSHGDAGNRAGVISFL